MTRIEYTKRLWTTADAVVLRTVIVGRVRGVPVGVSQLCIANDEEARKRLLQAAIPVEEL